ncbi:MAG: DsbA family protein [Nocardioides sp.]|uniref:DsbA family protein n=1 Tax=Nocardioides sp. TaxID=35761 RepID=UPI003EFFDBC5
MSNHRPAKKQPLSAAQRAEAQAKQAAKADRRAARKEEERLAQEAAAKKSRNRTLVAMVAGVAVVALVIWGFMKLTDDGPVNDPKGADGFSVVVGDADAPMTVTIYEDLQCPACANLENAIGESVNEAIEAGRIKVEYRIVSFLDHASGNDYSSRAGNILLAVQHTAGTDAFKSLHDTLFANQPQEGTDGPEDDELIAKAVEAGAVEDEVRPLQENMEFKGWLAAATDQWSKDGFNSTPTVLVDGEQLENPASELPALIAAQ